MKVLFLTRYSELGPSSRYRIFQYLNIYSKNNIQCFIQILFEEGKASKNPFYLLVIYLKRLLSIIRKDYDIIYLEKEFFPFFFDFIFIFKILNIKYIIDFDDAIFHNYDKSENILIKLIFKNKIPRLIKNASYVVTGSPYLTHKSLSYNKNVLEIPTSINYLLYKNRISIFSNLKFTIGWIGSKSTSKHLISIKNALIYFAKSFDCQIYLIGFDIDKMHYFENIDNIINIEWNQNTEIEYLYQISVGIMPLIDEPFERGKCGFKLIQYMACGIPTISTPLEANVKINRNNNNLFATTDADWINCFESVYLNRLSYSKIGEKNIEIVKKYYSIESNFQKYLDLFHKV